MGYFPSGSGSSKVFKVIKTVTGDGTKTHRQLLDTLYSDSISTEALNNITTLYLIYQGVGLYKAVNKGRFSNVYNTSNGMAAITVDIVSSNSTRYYFNNNATTDQSTQVVPNGTTYELGYITVE